jgi:hypothetical protein
MLPTKTVDEEFFNSNDNDPNHNTEDEPKEDYFESARFKDPMKLRQDFLTVVLPGLLYAARSMMVTGKPIIGKGVYVQGLGSSIATGVPFLGIRPWQGRVFHVDLEVPEPALYERYSGFCAHHAHGNLERQKELQLALSKRLRVLPLLAYQPYLLEEEFWEMLTAKALKWKPIFTSIDPLWRLLRSDIDETEIRRVCNHISRFCSTTGSALCVAHHQTKGEQASRDVIDRFSGRGDLARHFGTVMTLLETDPEQGFFTVQSRTNDFPPPEDKYIKRIYPLFELQSETERQKARSKERRRINIDPYLLLELFPQRVLGIGGKDYLLRTRF